MVEKEARGIALIGAINRGPGAQREGRRGGWLLRKPSSETLKCTPVVRFAGSHKFPLGAIPDSWDGVKRAGHLFRPGSVPADSADSRADSPLAVIVAVRISGAAAGSERWEIN